MTTKTKEAAHDEDRSQAEDGNREETLPLVNAVAPEELPDRERLESQGVDADAYTAGVAVTDRKNNLRH